MRKEESIEFMVEDVRVFFTKKRVKNINIRVKRPDGRVEVSAPFEVGLSSVKSFVEKKLSWIQERQETIATAPYPSAKEAEPEQIVLWKTQVEADAKGYIAYWEPIMGVRAKTTTFRNMTSRWGSCNPKTGRICINIQLANYPTECLEYVVVHELCHLIERGHGPCFKALLSQFMPDWKRRRAQLR